MRPKVSLLAVSEFNKVVTMDLKEVQVQKFKYILHIIDAYTRMSVGVFIKDKKPETIMHNVMENWVAVGYGRPRKIWTDVSGKFKNDTVKQLEETLGSKVETGTGYVAWMNDLNE